MGRDDVNAWWSGRVAAGHVHLPKSITRRQVGELCAAEALTATRDARPGTATGVPTPCPSGLFDRFDHLEKPGADLHLDVVCV